MIRIRALNEEESAESEEEGDDISGKPTKEAQEEEALSAYNRALILHAESKTKESAVIFEQILRSPFLNDVDDQNNSSPLQSQLRIGCLKILSKTYISTSINYEAAKRVLTEVISYEPQNVVLWCRLGIAEKGLANFAASYKAFRAGYECNPNYWGCIENLITIAYVLHEKFLCLQYCSTGLKKDRGFIKGMVFRDHIFELDPAAKEQARLANLDGLNVTYDYDHSWKTKYLDEVKKLMFLEIKKYSRVREEESEEQNQVIFCPLPFNSFSFVQLCSIVLKFHEIVKSTGSFMRPISLLPGTDDVFQSSNHHTQRTNSLTEEDGDAIEDMSRCSTIQRSSSDDKETAGLSAGNNEQEGTAESTRDVNFEDVAKPDMEGQEKEDAEVSPKRKSKKDKPMKWWQLEGKRRSQRVKGNLMPSTHKTSSKENKFLEKLKSIIPSSLLSEIRESSSVGKVHISPEKAKGLQNTEQYFGTEKEVADVKDFLAVYGSTNIVSVVICLVEILSKKNAVEWPSELAKLYVSLYELYRSHIIIPNSMPDPGDDLESLRTDMIVTLTVLELMLDQTNASSIGDLKRDKLFLPQLNSLTVQLNKLTQAVCFIDDRVLKLRLNWLQAKYYLLSNSNNTSLSALHYLNEVEIDLQVSTRIIRIPTQADNIISLDEVKKKLSFINRMENVNRIQELYNAKQFRDLIEILTFSLPPEDSTDSDLINRFYLAESYFQVEEYYECLEQCVKIINTVSCGKLWDTNVWTKTVTLVETICITKCKSEDVILPMSIRKSVVQSIFKLLVYAEKEIKNSSSTGEKLGVSLTTLWCVLHNILTQLEFQETAMYVDDENVPSSIQLLQFAHECFNASNNGCLCESGKLLLYTIKELVYLKTVQALHLDYEDTKHCIEQSIFCLYGHPNRKSKIRHLNDHNTGNGIPLEWDMCSYLYEYYKPDELPEVDSYNSISTDVETLFQRILVVMPEELKPSQTYQNLREYLDGKVEEIELVERSPIFPSQYSDIFYMIGDHHFKAKEWAKAVEHYTWDLAVSSVRFDSWAAIALAKGESINHGLNSCENFNIDEVVSNANTVVNCFRRALNLEPGNTKIKIEFGSFVYAMHSFCSRLLKQNSDLLSLGNFDMIESKKGQFLASAAKSFESMAGKPIQNDNGSLSQHEEERWIHHYMLGKVLEKLDPNDVKKFLDQYQMAGERLHQQGATYPSKISFYNPPELSVEALEIYYRIHSSVLNYIEKHPYSAEMDEILTKYLHAAAMSPFMRMKTTRGETTDAKRKKELQDSADITATLNSILNGVEDVLKEQELTSQLEIPDESQSKSSSGSSSSDDSSSDSSVVEIDYRAPDSSMSFGLSALRDKMLQQEARELKESASVARRSASIEPTGVKEKEQRKEVQPPLEPSQTNVLQSRTAEKVFVDMNPHFQENKYGHLISQCVFALEECISRFPAHHKSFYRLSYTYYVFANPKVRNKLCKEMLLGCGPLDKKKICGLFSDRRPNNFFNCVWRNPVDDIDRPGSFPYHMSKTISHLLEVLDCLNDHETLVEIAIQLSKVPDSDKQYLYNFEREQYSQQAFINSVASAKRFVLKNKHRIQDAGLAIYSSYVKLQKFNPKENVLASVLLDTYKMHLESTSKGIDVTGVTLEQAFRFYQHLTWTSKLQNKVKTSVASKVNSSTATQGAIASGVYKPESTHNGAGEFSSHIPQAQANTRVSWSENPQRNAIQASSSYSLPKIASSPGITAQCKPNFYVPTNPSNTKVSGSRVGRPIMSTSTYPSYSSAPNISHHFERNSGTPNNTDVEVSRRDSSNLSGRGAESKNMTESSWAIPEIKTDITSDEIIVPTDLSQKRIPDTSVIAVTTTTTTAVSVAPSALDDSDDIIEIMHIKPPMGYISTSPWVPSAVKRPGYYTTPPTSRSSSSAGTSVHGLPKVHPHPATVSQYLSNNIEPQSRQANTVPNILKTKRKLSPTNSSDGGQTENVSTNGGTPSMPKKKIRTSSLPSSTINDITISRYTPYNTVTAKQNPVSTPNDWSLRLTEEGLQNQLEPPAAHSQSNLRRATWVQKSEPKTNPVIEVIDLSPEKRSPLKVDPPVKPKPFVNPLEPLPFHMNLQDSPEKPFVNPLEDVSPVKEISQPEPRGTSEITFVDIDAVLGRVPSLPPVPPPPHVPISLPPKKKHKSFMLP